RLAGAVGPEQPEDRARGHLEAQPAQGLDAAVTTRAVGLGEVLGLDRGGAHRAPPSRSLRAPVPRVVRSSWSPNNIRVSSSIMPRKATTYGTHAHCHPVRE